VEKNLLNSNISSTCPHNMVNVSPLAAEIGSGVWGTPANFNVFCMLASLLQRRRSMEVNQTVHDVWRSLGLVHLYLALPPSAKLRRWAEGATYVPRPSRWASAHVLVSSGFEFCFLTARQEIGWEEHLRSDLFCVKWDVKPMLIYVLCYQHWLLLTEKNLFELNQYSLISSWFVHLFLHNTTAILQ